MQYWFGQSYSCHSPHLLDVNFKIVAHVALSWVMLCFPFKVKFFRRLINVNIFGNLLQNLWFPIM